MKTIVINSAVIFSFLILLACNRDVSYQFPSNIAYSYCLDMIEIDEPVLYCLDSSNIYVTSAKYLDYVEAGNPDSCIFLIPVATHEDCLWEEDWKYSEYQSKYECRKFTSLRRENEDFTAFEYFDFRNKTQSGASIYDFKVLPERFMVMLVPDYCYAWPPNSDVYCTLPGRERKLKLLPIYSRAHRKVLRNVMKYPTYYFSEGGIIWYFPVDVNPLEWIAQN